MSEKGNQNFIIRKQANPVYASELLNPYKEKPEDRLSWGKKFLQLPRYLRYGMIKKETEEKIIQTANRFGFRNPQDLGKISRLVRGILCGDIESSRVGVEIEEKMGVRSEKKNELEKEIKDILVFIKESGSQSVEADLIKGEISELMSKYEEIKEQEIGINNLDVEGEGLPPTIENWLYDYKMKLGTGVHSSLQRSGYAYNSLNAKKLERKEREKLSVVLDSYDNKKKIWYNKLFQEIDFEAILSPEKVFGKKEVEQKNSEKKPFSIKKMENKPFYEADFQKRDNDKKDDFSKDGRMEKASELDDEKRRDSKDKKEEEFPKNSSKQDFQQVNTVDLNDYL